MVSDVRIILASKSPRRHEIIRSMGIPFEVAQINVAESYPGDLDLKDVPVYLAKKKAAGYDHELQPQEILLTADTVVLAHGQLLGKPADYEDAFVMLGELANSTHSVVSGVCLQTANDQKAFAVETQVTFGPLGEGEIRHYLDVHQPFDKAGSYGIQDWIGLIGITRIEGSYSNVVGLPGTEVYRAIKSLS